MYSVVCEHDEVSRTQIAEAFAFGTLTDKDKLFALREGVALIGAGVMYLTGEGAQIGKILPADGDKSLRDMLLRAMLFSFSGKTGIKITADIKPEFPGFIKNGVVWEIMSENMIFNCGGKINEN